MDAPSQTNLAMRLVIVEEDNIKLGKSLILNWVGTTIIQQLIAILLRSPIIKGNWDPIPSSIKRPL